MSTTLSENVVFNDPKLARRYAKKPIPMATLYEAYFDGDIDIPGDIYAFLREPQPLRQVHAHAGSTCKWAVTNFIPEVAIHSKEQDERIVREHYDRGNDFFGWFLGERMVYTSRLLPEPGRDARAGAGQQAEPRLPEAAARAGRALARHRLRLGHARAPRRRVLRRRRDRRHDRQEPDRVRQRAHQGLGRRRTARASSARDYRDIPAQKFDKIVSLEMVEHVGVKNLVPFYEQVRDLLDRRRPVPAPVDRPAPRPAPRGPDLGPLHEQVHLPRRRREPAARRPC